MSDVLIRCKDERVVIFTQRLVNNLLGDTGEVGLGKVAVFLVAT